MPQKGNLIKMTDPVWDWLKKGDIGIIVKVREWKGGHNGKTIIQYLYTIRFTSGELRTINSREFSVIA